MHFIDSLCNLNVYLCVGWSGRCEAAQVVQGCGLGRLSPAEDPSKLHVHH